MMNMYPFFGFPPYYRNYNNYRRRPSPVAPVVPPASASAPANHTSATHAPAGHATHAPKNSGNFSLHNFDNFSSKSVQKPYTPSNFSNNFSGNFNSNSSFGNSASYNASFGNLHSDENSASKEPEVNNDVHFYDECFEILGLKLHFDDLLIMCILFFLYQEEVKDSYLYIALILLLLS